MSAKNAVVSKYYSGQGIVLVAKRNPTTGAPMGYRNVGNVSELTLSVNTETVEHKESSTGVRGVDLRLTTGITCEVSMMMESFNRENLQMALRGDGKTEPGATVTNELVTGYLGMTIPLANINVTAVTSVADDEVGTNVYTEGTDYEVNLETGSLVILEGGAITNAQDLYVTYDFGDYENLEALTEPAEDLYVRFEGLNTADGNKPVVVEIFRLQPDPLNELALINNQIADFTVEGNAMADLSRPAGTSNYFREMHVA